MQYMKRFLMTMAAVLVSAVAALAQTPEEIFDKVDEVMDRAKENGMSMTMTMKIPIVGSFSTKMYILGEKTRAEMKAMGRELIIWTDGKCSWSYDAKENTIVIEDELGGTNDDNGLNMMDGLTDGYDVKLDEESEKAWFFICKKRKDNPDKDSPKKMEITIRKSDYSLGQLKTSMKGVTLILSNISIGGISEASVTFDASKYPDATIEDKRGKK